MIQNIIIVILLAALTISWVVMVLNIKTMKRLQKCTEVLIKSIDTKKLSEEVLTQVMKYVYLPLGYDRIKVFK